MSAPTEKAFSYLVKVTESRPLSEAEARRKVLSQLDGDAEAADAVVDRARRAGVLDDHAFATMWVEDRGRRRGYGAARLRRELERRQVPGEVAEAALATIADRDEEAVAAEIARARLARMPTRARPEVVARRLLGHLLRRGFTAETAHRVARRVTELDREWD